MSANFCPQCGTPTAGAAYCRSCGAYVRGTPGERPAVPVALTHPQPATLSTGLSPEPLPYAAQPGKPPVSQGMAIAGLILNILIWPGLGSLIAGENVGWAQGFLFLAGLILMIFLVGIPLAIGAWVWGLVTGIQLVQRSSPPA